MTTTDLTTRLITYCDEHALTLGGSLVAELRAYGLDSERAQRLLNYCDLHTLTLGGLVDEVRATLPAYAVNYTPAYGNPLRHVVRATSKDAALEAFSIWLGDSGYSFDVCIDSITEA